MIEFSFDFELHNRCIVYRIPINTFIQKNPKYYVIDKKL